MRLYEFAADQQTQTPLDVAGSSRGFKNNNPGNIRKNKRNPWVGKIENGTDSAFEQFVYPEFGIRAMMKLFVTYSKRYKLNTITKILSRYAPNNENDTEKYIQFVSQKTGKGANDPLDMTNEQEMSEFIKSLIQMENGSQPYNDQQISTGIKMAFDQSVVKQFIDSKRNSAA